jgi:hypothetical protein
LAIELARRSPADPRTLARAARDFAERQPEFALDAAMEALTGIVRGYGYDITPADMQEAHAAALRAAAALSLPQDDVNQRVRELLSVKSANGAYVAKALGIAT